jgi:addiction module HigA family antidote
MTSITKGSNNVYADLGIPDAEQMLLKSQLAHRITLAIEAKGLSVLEASRIVGLAQPKLKSILRGQFHEVSENEMREYLSRLDHRLDEIHPGEILLEEFMKPMNMSTSELADVLDLPLSEINAIINGQLSIAMNVALRLSKLFSMDPKFWFNLQIEYDSRKSKRGLILGPLK